MATTSVEAICFKSKALKNGEFPILLRLTKSRQRKYLSLGVSVNPQHWDFPKNRPKRNCPNKDMIESVIQREKELFQEQIKEYAIEGKEYTLNTLVMQVKKPEVLRTFRDYIEGYILSLKNQKRFGSARMFHELKESIQSYKPCLDFYFSDIDIPWLRGYEKQMRDNNNKENTIGIRFRALRVLYNRAIADNIVKSERYPFKIFKVSAFQEQTAKRAITKEMVEMIRDLDVKTISNYHYPYLQHAKDLFMFSYLCCGMNMTDMLRLRYTNIVDGTIRYSRQKTGKLIIVPIQSYAIIIIDKYRRDGTTKDDYVFPILNRKIHKTETQIRDKVEKATKATNAALGKIGEKLGFSIKLTTYVARHSYATVLKRAGVSTAIISESLGHSSEKVTQIYLDSFENSQIDEAMKNLL